jgi:hypothetical protein
MEFLTGDVLASLTKPSYIRIGHPHPSQPRIFVHDCTPEGHLIGLTGRYLLATTIATRYHAHSSPKQSI